MLAEDSYFLFVTSIMRYNVLSVISISCNFGPSTIHQRQLVYLLILFTHMMTGHRVCIIIVFVGICSSSISYMVLNSSVGKTT